MAPYEASSGAARSPRTLGQSNPMIFACGWWSWTPWGCLEQLTASDKFSRTSSRLACDIEALWVTNLVRIESGCASDGKHIQPRV